MTFKNNIRPDFMVSLFLVLLTLGVYWQVRDHEFISFDDNTYITENRHVKTGLTQENILWAFRFSDKGGTYWHPLTWLSHMTDCHFYGLNPGMHHTTNLLFHIANTILLFLLFKRMTGALWQSAFVAALFALHPLNTDSVAWVAERKNVLSTFFWILTMLAYVRYTEHPGFFRYMTMFLSFVLGLLSKPMLVTLPCVLLLLDYWPLKRFLISDCRFPIESKNEMSPAQTGDRKSKVLWEKLPLFALSAASVCLSSLSLQRYKNIIFPESVLMTLRIENALVSYVRYILKMICPQNLAFYYPYPDSLPTWQSLGAAILLVIISYLTIRAFRSMPYLITGWLWYLGTLVPVSGLIQAGLWPATADRWAYVPLIGLFIMIAGEFLI